VIVFLLASDTKNIIDASIDDVDCEAVKEDALEDSKGACEAVKEDDLADSKGVCEAVKEDDLEDSKGECEAVK